MNNNSAGSLAPALHPVGGAETKNTLKIFALLTLVALVPTSIFYVFGTSSQAVGVAIIALVALGLAAIDFIKHPNTRQMLAAFLIIGVILIGILSHGLIAYYFQPLVFSRLIQSLLLFGLMLVGAYILRFAVFNNDDKSLENAILGIFTLLVAIGVAAIIGIRPIEAVTSSNPVFPFTEPSHYALTFTPILLFVCTTRNLVLRLAALLTALTIAYLLQSLSLVVGVLLVGLITLPIAYLIIAGFAIAIAISVLDITYFTDRLDLNSDSGNLSVLVYLQGWELASDSVARTSGWGLGFQQLGFGPINSPTADIVYRLAGNDSNLKDGGFTLAKGTSEFGALGFIAIMLYGVLAARTAWMLRAIALRSRPATMATALAMSIISGYAVEAFIRGIGYFSGSTMMLVAALVYLNGTRAKLVVNSNEFL